MLMSSAHVAKFRTDRLVLLAQGVLGSKFAPTDEYILGKLHAAEADASRRLRTFFEPTTVFAYVPSQAEITALGAGALWVEESAYDYEPHTWTTEDWGYLVVRKTPVISVDSVVFAYPSPTSGVFTMPLEWVRIDKKAGHLRFIPSGSSMQAGPLSSFVMSVMGGGRMIPQMIRIKYRAGLQNAAAEYPDLIDLINKMAALRVVQDAYLPQSSSISADGLSQSISVNMDAYHDGVDAAIDTLLQSIHGMRMMVL